MEGNNRETMHPSFQNVLRQKERVKENLRSIRHKIGVYSAKGGVGKTTISVNLAYALREKGFKVGLLDADIDCPNVCMFMGIDSKMDPRLPLRPLEKDGIKVASTAMLTDDSKAPIIWRGPIITKMLYEFLTETEWGTLDYLIIDMGPGTSDPQLTVMQALDIDGFLIVTTPQRIAAVNSIKSGMMAKRLGRHVIGVIENMSSMEKGEGNSQLVADSLNTDVIGKIPNDPRFCESSDTGNVLVQSDKDITNLFMDIAGRLPR